MLYHFKIHKDPSGGYWAECLELEGCQTQAETLKELYPAMAEALDLYLSEPHWSNLVFPFPKQIKLTKTVVEVQASPRVAFSALLRRERSKRHLSQRDAASLMGFKSVFAYQKLEAPKSANPGLDTLEKIKEVMPSFPINRIFGG